MTATGVPQTSEGFACGGGALAQVRMWMRERSAALHDARAVAANAKISAEAAEAELRAAEAELDFLADAREVGATGLALCRLGAVLLVLPKEEKRNGVWGC